MDTSFLTKPTKDEFFNTFLKDAFPGASDTEELKTCAKELMFNQGPQKFEVIKVRGTSERFKASYKSTISTSTELESFIHIFSHNNNITLRIACDKAKTLSARSQYVDIKYYRCQHKTRCVSTRDNCPNN